MGWGCMNSRYTQNQTRVAVRQTQHMEGGDHACSNRAAWSSPGQENEHHKGRGGEGRRATEDGFQDSQGTNGRPRRQEGMNSFHGDTIGRWKNRALHEVASQCDRV